MKQNNRSMWVPKVPDISVAKHGKQSRRVLINRFFRRLMILLLVLIIAASLLAGFISLQPFAFTWNSDVLRYSRAGTVDYFVNLKDGSFGDQQTAGQDLVYLDNLVTGVEPTFIYTFDTDRPVDIRATWQVDTIVRVRDADDPSVVLLAQSSPAVPVKTADVRNTKSWIMNESIKIDLEPYRAIAAAFAANNTARVTYELAVVFSLNLAANPYVSVEPVILSEPLVLIIPLNQPQYSIRRELPPAMAEWATVHQNIRYKVHLAGIPFGFYPVAAGLAFIVLVIFLALTCSRPKDRFRGRLGRMLRKARGRLMLIGDKAWEPEWCVAVTDFRAMVRTARRLKHPIFCFIDKMKPWPVAYFYVYYGENNYCYIYTEHPEMLHEEDSALASDSARDGHAAGGSGTLGHPFDGGAGFGGSPGGTLGGNFPISVAAARMPVQGASYSESDDEVVLDELDDAIPVLPETDDPLNPAAGPDITLAK